MKCYVEVDFEEMEVVAGMASAIAKSAAHRTTENLILRTQVVEGIVEIR